jgi:hypothetical protein
VRIQCVGNLVAGALDARIVRERFQSLDSPDQRPRLEQVGTAASGVVGFPARIRARRSFRAARRSASCWNLPRLALQRFETAFEIV